MRVCLPAIVLIFSPLMVAVSAQGAPVSATGNESRSGPVVQAPGFLGVMIDPGASGLRVDLVLAGGPADRWGIREGDIIVKIDQMEVKHLDVLIKTVTAHPAGTRVAVQVLRGGRKQTIDVTLGSVPR